MPKGECKKCGIKFEASTKKELKEKMKKHKEEHHS
jgi:hypothetical protein